MSLRFILFFFFHVFDFYSRRLPMHKPKKFFLSLDTLSKSIVQSCWTQYQRLSIVFLINMNFFDSFIYFKIKIYHISSILFEYFYVYLIFDDLNWSNINFEKFFCANFFSLSISCAITTSKCLLAQHTSQRWSSMYDKYFHYWQRVNQVNVIVVNDTHFQRVRVLSSVLTFDHHLQYLEERVEENEVLYRVKFYSLLKDIFVRIAL